MSSLPNSDVTKSRRIINSQTESKEKSNKSTFSNHIKNKTSNLPLLGENFASNPPAKSTTMKGLSPVRKMPKKVNSGRLSSRGGRRRGRGILP